MNLIKRTKELQNEINIHLKDSNIVVEIIDNKDFKTGKINIIQNGKIDKVYEIKARNMDEIDILKDNKVIEENFYRHNLGAFIYNLYNPVKYLYNFYGGNLDGKVLTREEIEKLSNDLTKDNSEVRRLGISSKRKELDAQPKVEEYYEPLYDGIDYGEIHLRYEVRGEPWMLLI